MEHAVNLGVYYVVPACHTWETQAKNYVNILPSTVSYVPLIDSGAEGIARDDNFHRIVTFSAVATAHNHAYRDAIFRYALL